MAPSSNSGGNNNNPPQQQQLDGVQLRDVQDVLRQPLTGRRVLIPLGGNKAFVAGTLQPTRNDAQEELIQLRAAGSGELQTVTRQDAVAQIQTERQALTANKKPASKATTRQSSSAKKSPPTNSTNASAPTARDAAAVPNFFDIREEIDEQGKEVSSEAVNITNHLKLWENEMRKRGVESSAPPSTDMVDAEVADESSPSSSSDTVEHDNTSTTAQKVSDEDFAALSARLDQLARLEEEEETRRQENRKSAKKLRSKGWAKGFLNKPSSSSSSSNKRVPQKPKAAGISQPQQGEASSPVQSTTPIAAKPPSDAQHVANRSQTETPGSRTDTPTSTRAVGFKETNQVREIPRIGQRSVGEIQKPVKPLQSSIVSQVVRERPRKGRQPKGAAGTTSTDEDNNPPQRKLSRFAQQRMGLS